VPRKLSFTLIILTALASSAPAGIAAPHGAKQPTSTTDDTAIYSAVLQYAYRSKVSGGGKHSEPVSDATVMLQDSTVTICPTEEDRAVPYSHGLGEKDLEKCFAHPETKLSPRVAAELSEAVFEGCAASNPIDVDGIEGATRQIDARDYVALSHPGYARDGYAIVYGEHHCGVLCGSASLFILKRSESGWKVIRQAVLWIS